MTINEYHDFLNVIGTLKHTYRHSFTQADRKESVADHTFLTSVMALLLCDEIEDANMDKVIKMCLIHDFGECITGDIPAFIKTETDEVKELDSISDLLAHLPLKNRKLLQDLFCEIQEGKSKESKIFKALDKLEAILQHNSAPLNTWIELEKSLNLTYGEKESQDIEFLRDFRALLKEYSIKKIEKGD